MTLYLGLQENVWIQRPVSQTSVAALLPVVQCGRCGRCSITGLPVTVWQCHAGPCLHPRLPSNSDPGIYIFLISSPYSSSSVLAWVCDPPPAHYFVWWRLLIILSQNPVSSHRTSFVLPQLSLLDIIWALLGPTALFLSCPPSSGLYFASTWNITSI